MLCEDVLDWHSLWRLEEEVMLLEVELEESERGYRAAEWATAGPDCGRERCPPFESVRLMRDIALAIF